MSRKKDEEDAMSIVFLIICVCCSLAFGWVAGIIIAVIALFGMAFEDTSKNSMKKTTTTKSLFEIIEEDKKKAGEKKKKQIEKEMDDYGLSEEEKELVRSGEYEPYQFEEENMDEDDYYSEDE